MVEFSCMQNVKMMVGEGCSRNAGMALMEAGYKKVFLVYDAGVKATGIIGKIIESVQAAGLQYVEFDKVLPDPPAEIINEGAKICVENKCDCVMGIGGGSAIDTAKGINLLRVNGGSILDYASPEKEVKLSRGLMSIPTTSGTGSELSGGIIVSDTVNEIKVPILAVNAMSEFAVLDPAFAAGMPVGLTIATGLDVFSHAAEGYTTILANPMMDMVAESVMANVVEYLPQAVKNPSDMEARTRMHVAASFGGWLLANPSAHVGHSIAHVIGGYYHIPHGACCAYSLPVVLEVMAETLPEKVKKIGAILGAEYTGNETSKEIGTKAADAYRKFAYEVVGMKKISEYVPDLSGITDLADRVVNEPLASIAPFKVTRELAEKMLGELAE